VGRMSKIVFLILIALSSSLFAREKEDPYIREIKEVISEYSSGDFYDTANMAYKLAKSKGTGEANYYLAKALYNMELSHASAEFLYDAALNGGNVLDEVIRCIRFLMAERPYDYDLLVKDLLGDHVFGVLNQKNADFIHYYKGLLAYNDGVNKWKVNSFKKIRPYTDFSYKAEFVDVVDDVKRWKITNALKGIENLARKDIKDQSFKNDVLQTYARLLFQKKEYFKAFDIYRIIGKSPTESESIFLEKAWTLFYLQDYQASLGNLLSLDAKIFEGFNKPERFVLQGLIFKRLCQYDLATSTIEAFKKTYKDILIGIKERRDINKDPYMLGAFKRHSKVRKLVEFYELLKWEYNRLYDYESKLDDTGLFKTLVKIYKFKIAEIGEQIKNLKKDVYPLIASVLLDAEEQINYLEYEVKMDKLRKTKIFLTEEEKRLFEESIGEEDIASNGVFKWPFEGEFWTDELGTFRVIVKDACAMGGGM
jgi:hypothetical protein